MGATLVNVNIFSPALVAKGEKSAIRFMLGVSVIANVTVYVVYPSGISEQIDISRFSTPDGIVYSADFNFSESGYYSFYAYDSTLTEYCFDGTYSAEWASKIDVPVSQLGRQRADIQRIYGRVSNK